MDQDASNNEGDEQVHPISHDTRSETPLAEDATMDNTSITPEAEMDIDLPHFRRTEEVDSPPRKKIRLEIPDSEEASEVSSPVKNDGNDEQKREEALELEHLQMDQVAPEQNFEQEDNRNGERKTARTEILESEEESKFSSPIKVGLGPVASRDEVAQEAGRLEACEEGKLKEVETGGTTMMDISAPEFAEGIFDTSRSRIEEVNVWVRTKKSGNGTVESVDNMKEIESTIADGTSPTSITKNGGIAQQTSPVDNQDARSADTSTNLAAVEEINSEISHADANGGVILHETPQDKGNAGPMETFARMPLSSPNTHTKGIAAAAQRLLDEISPTFSDVNNTRETPKILKNSTSIPDSDEEENDELDAQVLGLSQFPCVATQLPAYPNQIPRDKGTPEAAIFYSASNVAIEEQQQKVEDIPTAASCTALKGANSQPVTISASDVVPSTSMVAIESPSKKHVASQPIASMEQSSQGTEVQQATEIPSSLTDVQAPPMPPITEESSQATDTSSSSPQPMRRGFFAAKKNDSPPASFIVPEAVQSKDVLMAELKAMKIASIQNRISALEAEIAKKRTKLEEVAKGLKQPAAQTVKTHIKLLHDYNDIKDVGQGLIGMIADNRGVRVGELYEEFGVGLKD